jgi:hypothetical protein
MCGFYTLDTQAAALGLSRSTAYTIVTGQHKSSGISARIIAQMLCSPELPCLVRSAIEAYVREKTSGVYGGRTNKQQRRFYAIMHRNDVCIHGIQS